ncbi:MAG TPA: response regulator transcription factor [Roseiflexaceae bacterium]|nr:response regulator transcription factor [Roseiflexaceae bacterium]
MTMTPTDCNPWASISMTRTTVLVIEDDASIRRGLVDALSFAGYGVLQCADGAKAVPAALENEIDLVLLDVMLPGRDGFSILGELRKAKPTLPVIMVTARGAEGDRVRGLSDGADDYVVKPFSAKELLARVEAVLRRSPERPSDVHELRLGDARIDLDRREITGASGEVSSLSEREAEILRYLASNADRAVDRDELLQRVWGLDPKNIETRTVDMHIARLREKLGDSNATIIQTVRGKGYMLGQTSKRPNAETPKQGIAR